MKIRLNLYEFLHQTMLKFSLELGQMALLEAANGNDGIEIARTKDPDLILLNWMLPDQSGIDVVKSLKAQALSQ